MQKVVGHYSPPDFRLTVRLMPVSGGTLVNWDQVFADEGTAQAVKAIVGPANEQNLDRLTIVLGKVFSA